MRRSTHTHAILNLSLKHRIRDYESCKVCLSHILTQKRRGILTKTSLGETTFESQVASDSVRIWHCFKEIDPARSLPLLRCSRLIENIKRGNKKEKGVSVCTYVLARMRQSMVRLAKQKFWPSCMRECFPFPGSEFRMRTDATPSAP